MRRFFFLIILLPLFETARATPRISSENKLKIIHNFLAHVKAEEKPKLIVIAGVSGAGKSTFRKMLLSKKLIPSNAVLHEPDLVLEQIDEFKEKSASWANLSKDARQKLFKKWEAPALDLSLQILQKALRLKSHIIYERTCSTEKTIEFLQLARHSGYWIELNIISVPISLAKKRVQSRNSLQSRYTLLSAVEDKAKKLKRNIPAMVKLAHLVNYLDGSSTDFEVIK